MQAIDQFTAAFLDLALAIAPWLVIGLVLAGLIQVALPERTVLRHIGGHGPGSILKAASIGLPLPLCSCGAIPVALSLHRRGAGRGPASAFLVSTPGIGIDAMILTAVLLGPWMAIARLTGAFTTAMAVGLGMSRGDGKRPSKESLRGPTPCCTRQTRPPEHDSRSTAHTDVHRTLRKCTADLLNAIDSLIDEVGLPMVAGLIVAAVMITLVPPDSLAMLGDGVMAKLLFALIGIPLYICAAAATPIAAAMIMSGVSPGTALVFLIAGPVTSFATLTVLRNAFGWIDLARYLLVITATSILIGVAVDLLFSTADLAVTPQSGPAAAVVPGLLAWGALGIVGILTIRAIAQRLKRPARTPEGQF